MVDRPMLFSAPMVRAILREIDAPGTGKTQTRRVLGHHGPGRGRYNIFSPEVAWSDSYVLDDGNAEWRRRSTPPWASGDRLWVRETWCEYAKGEAWYRADHEKSTFVWTPSIHMPRWASRLTLTVTNVRVQRLQDISEADALAEGVACDSNGWRGSFATLWDSLNAKRAPWSSNPWVCAISFTPRLGNIDSEATQ